MNNKIWSHGKSDNDYSDQFYKNNYHVNCHVKYPRYTKHKLTSST